MGMQRVCFTMSEEDLDNFDRGRAATSMSRSAYIRLLIAEHEKVVPGFILYKDIIEQLSELNTSTKQLLLQDSLSINEKNKIEAMYSNLSDLIKLKII